MKIVAFSDIHGQGVALLKVAGVAREVGADLLIFAGDLVAHHLFNNFCESLYKVIEFVKAPIIMTPGNHDFWKPQKYFPKVNIEKELGIVCLIEESYEYRGVKFWGSPYVNWIDGKWNYERKVNEHRFDIPTNTEVVITHSPMFGFSDQTLDGRHIGSELLTQVISEVKPKLHIFGHLHDGGWRGELGNTELANVAMTADNTFRLVHEGIFIKEL